MSEISSTSAISAVIELVHSYNTIGDGIPEATFTATCSVIKAVMGWRAVGWFVNAARVNERGIYYLTEDRMLTDAEMNRLISHMMDSI
jgi:hypothetical protein